MPQYPLVPQPGGTQSTLNITAATVIKALPGRVYTVSVLVAGSAAGAVYDSTSTSGNTAADQIASLPNAVAFINTNAWPCANGIVVAPGTGQTVAVAWS
ncbi:hypothetical protein AWB78_01337 [Caballeronia calidae]|uniref:Uncharacterized protein n=1 Tax=Caballeronia calidae TaxID=1777139 RepID=A0A158A6U3_9BURK|nr:hypothetical protein [Caballeronia calidae]SAK53552.1 hypothetical protein AWB78_01337 [Caballeronia calidae]